MKCPLCGKLLIAYNMIGGRVYCNNPECKLDNLEAHLKKPIKESVS